MRFQPIHLLALLAALASPAAFAESDHDDDKPVTAAPEPWILVKTDQICIYRTDSKECRKVKRLQIKQYSKLASLKDNPCPPAKEKSCKALEATLADLIEQTNRRIVSACNSAWMLSAAGIGPDGKPLPKTHPPDHKPDDKI